MKILLKQNPLGSDLDPHYIVADPHFYYQELNDCRLFYFFMYRRPILWTLYGAVDFLKVLKIAVVGVLLVHSAYIMSLLMMAGIKYWDVMYRAGHFR